VSKTLAPLARFWWLVLVGVVAGVAAAAFLIERQPPPKYQATATVLVTSPSAPYLRTAQPALGGAAAKAPAKGKKAPSAPAATAPDTQVLVNAANLYPLMIESDKIRKLREQLFGKLPGRVTANAFASSTNTYGVYHPSPLPVIVVTATSRKPGTATKLVDDTVETFRTWVGQRQADAKVPASQRIMVEQLRVRVATLKSSSFSMPLFAALVVLAAFCGIALLADRLRPAPRAAVTPIEREETPMAPRRATL
jgi:capsular polysaccharide biosynthesis protein